MKPELPEECRGCFGRTGEWSLVGEGGGGGVVTRGVGWVIRG